MLTTTTPSNALKGRGLVGAGAFPIVHAPHEEHAVREATWLREHAPSERRRVLGMLRKVVGEGERVLTGWPAILAWLESHGFRNRRGGPLTPPIVRGWVRTLRCPIKAGSGGAPGRQKSSPPWTSNFLLLAWAVTLPSGGPRMPRVVAA